MKRRIVLLGPPASGKGTLADALKEQFSLPVASPGAMLRAEKAVGTELGQEADRLTRNGKLLSDEIINRVVQHWLSQQKADGFIFDGYPRTLGQAEALDQMLRQQQIQLDAVFLLDASVEALHQRVAARVTCSQCGYIAAVGLQIPNAEGKCPRCGGHWTRRSDDHPETLTIRLQEYEEKTVPVIGYYEKQSLLYRLPTERPPSEVAAEAIQILQS